MNVFKRNSQIIKNKLNLCREPLFVAIAKTQKLIKKKFEQKNVLSNIAVKWLNI